MKELLATELVMFIIVYSTSVNVTAVHKMYNTTSKSTCTIGFSVILMYILFSNNIEFCYFCINPNTKHISTFIMLPFHIQVFLSELLDRDTETENV